MNLMALLLLIAPTVTLAFSSPRFTSPLVKSSERLPLALFMAPRFDAKENKWVVTSPEEGPDAGYGIWGSLLRQGPSPFFNRVFKAEEYDQAVLKFMAGDNVDRNTAQAEMDAYLRNPNDWAYYRMEGVKVDYLTLRTKDIALTLVWSILILTLAGRGVYCLETGENFWAILGLSSKAAECAQYNTCLIDV